MDREELVGIQTIWWVDYQLAVGFLTGSWKSNMDVWISNQLFGNPTACLSWPRCNGGSLQGESTTNAAAAEREGICEENWPIDKAGLTVSWFSHSMNIAQLPRVNECV